MTKNTISRREFLKLFGLVAAGAVAAQAGLLPKAEELPAKEPGVLHPDDFTKAYDNWKDTHNHSVGEEGGYLVPEYYHEALLEAVTEHKIIVSRYLANAGLAVAPEDMPSDNELSAYMFGSRSVKVEGSVDDYIMSLKEA